MLLNIFIALVYVFLALFIITNVYLLIEVYKDNKEFEKTLDDIDKAFKKRRGY